LSTVLTNHELQAINLLERNTGAQAKDAVFTDSTIIFVVKTGDLGKAIGKQGRNIAALKRIFSKEIQVVEEAGELSSFVSNLFYPAQVIETKENLFESKKVLLVKVDSKSKGLAIGNGGEKIKRARLLLKRHYSIDDVKII